MNGNNHYRTALYADYLITGVLKVVKKDNYLLFSNPGSLRIPVEPQFRNPTNSLRSLRSKPPRMRFLLFKQAFCHILTDMSA